MSKTDQKCDFFSIFFKIALDKYRKMLYNLQHEVQIVIRLVLLSPNQVKEI